MRDRLPILTAVLHDQRRALGWWALALAAISAMYLSFYPSMGGDAMDDLIAGLPDDVVVALGYDRMGTAAGWITTTVYGLLGPVLLLVFAIAGGANLLAGEEEAGHLELELTMPIRRRRILVERWVAQAVGTAFLVGVITATTWVMILLLDLDVGLDRLLAATVGLLLLIVGHGAVAYAIGAATGRRALALGIGAAVAVAGFMADALGPVVGWDWLSAISPFTWYLGNEPLANGFDGWGLAKLGVVPIVALAVAIVMFPRRDVMV